jgi:xylulose-5-phosphate/fructose-6-phosphate phosphoketolase
MGEMHENPEHVRILEEWMKSYRPSELSTMADDCGRNSPNFVPVAPAA